MSKKKQRHGQGGTTKFPWQSLSVEISKAEDSPAETGTAPEPMAMFVGLEVLDGSQFRVDSRNNTKFMVLNNNKEESVPPAVTAVATKDPAAEKKRKKKKKKKKKRKNENVDKPIDHVPGEENNKSKGPDDKGPTKTPTVVAAIPNSAEVDKLQQSWMIATSGVVLHQDLCLALQRHGFEKPTPIQASSLAASILGRRNIVGAAATGSGKTLAYVIPIVQHLLGEETTKSLQALILTPTRELALQVSGEFNKLMKKCSATCVGGMAVVKQQRMLTKEKPPVLVATPGRLWDLMSSGQYEHLQDLSQLRFLVIDEADRMMLHPRSFPQLHQIFGHIHSCSMSTLLEDDEGESTSGSEDDDDDDDERMRGLPGIRGEAKVQMLTPDLLDQVDLQRNGNIRDEPPEPQELENEEFERLQQEQQETLLEDDNNFVGISQAVQRQTMVFSATLTLPPSSSYATKNSGNNKAKQKTVEGGIAEILDMAKATGPVKVVDLTTSKEPAVGPDVAKPMTVATRLPPGLSLRHLRCTQRHKDSYLYAYLTTTAEGSSGPALVFCNSIAAVKRVGATLQALRLPVRMLHAQMAQKARFKAVESLRQTEQSIVVTSDVAARGLDMCSVSTVVHYDVARTPDTFIHRSGRTARGIGAVGCSLSLVSPAETKAHEKICNSLGSQAYNKRIWETPALDGRLISRAQERVALATKIVSFEQEESKTRKHVDWIEQAALDAELDLENDEVEALQSTSVTQLRNLHQIKANLQTLLSVPMRTQRYGKFLSSNSAAHQTQVTSNHAAQFSHKRKGKRKR